MVLLANAGLWICVVLYLISWVVGLSQSPQKTKWEYQTQIQTLRFGCIFHASFLGYSYSQGFQWPQNLVSDLLNFVAWGSIAVFVLFKEKLENVINSAVIPIFAVVLMIISSSISSGNVPALAFINQEPWLRQTVLVIHIITLIAGHLLFALACGSSILFLYQEHQIKTKLVKLLVTRFPSLGTLKQISYRSSMWGFLFLTGGLILGVILNEGPQQRNLVRLGVSIVVWLTYAMFLIERRIQGYEGKRIVFWPIIGFCIVLIAIMLEVYHLSR